MKRLLALLLALGTIISLPAHSRAGSGLTFFPSSMTATGYLDNENTLQVSYTGSLAYDYPLYPITCPVMLQKDVASPQSPSGKSGVGIRGFNGYSEANALSPSLTSISFDNIDCTIADLAPLVANGLTKIEAPLLASAFSSLLTNPLPALQTVSFPSLKFVQGAFITTNSAPHLTTISAPVLKTISSMNITTGVPLLSSVDLPSLTECVGALSIANAPSLVTLNFPSLKRAGGTMTFNGDSALSTLSAPQLATAGNISATLCPALDNVDLSGLVKAGSIDIASSPSMAPLSYVTLGTVGITKALGSPLNLSGYMLTSSSMDQILAVVASLDGTNGTTLWGPGNTLIITGGPGISPSAAGYANRDIIVARGGTVVTN